MEQPGGILQNFKKQLIKDHLGYQGLVYRKAAQNISHYIDANQNTKHVLLVFNALTAAEQQIFQELLELDQNEVIWDADSYFLEDVTHSASLFLRGYKKIGTTIKKIPSLA